MKFILIIASTFLFFCIPCLAQVFSGRVMDAASYQSIPYAKIGIASKNSGTVSDVLGYFQLDLTELHNADTLIISAYGYKNEQLLIEHCRDHFLYSFDIPIQLTAENKELEEITVSAAGRKLLKTGNNIHSSLIVAGFQNKTLGAELGTVLEYRKKQKGHLVRLHFNILPQNEDTVKFRINLYTMEDGKPGNVMISKPLYFVGLPEQKTITINVEKENIQIVEDAFLTIELIENVGMDGLFFKSGFLRSPSFYRNAPEGLWLRAKVDLGFWAEIAFKK